MGGIGASPATDLLAPCPWTSHFTFLVLSSFICKMGQWSKFAVALLKLGMRLRLSLEFQKWWFDSKLNFLEVHLMVLFCFVFFMKTISCSYLHYIIQ